MKPSARAPEEERAEPAPEGEGPAAGRAGWGGARGGDLPPERIRAALQAHDEALRSGDERVAKRGRKSAVTRHGDLVVKEHLARGWLGRGKDRLAPARHRAGLENAGRLVEAGVATARPLAWVRRGGRAFSLYEDLSGLPRLDHLARRLYALPDRAGQVRLREESAAWLGLLHRPGDLPRRPQGRERPRRRGGRAPLFHLIDTDRVRFLRRPVGRRRRAKNLAQLAASIPVSVTRTERLRWYRRYAALAGLVVHERGMARAVARRLARKTRVVDQPIE